MLEYMYYLYLVYGFFSLSPLLGTGLFYLYKEFYNEQARNY